MGWRYSSVKYTCLACARPWGQSPAPKRKTQKNKKKVIKNKEMMTRYNVVLWLKSWRKKKKKKGFR
jgi:hypothetical protein